jgi:predicted KAP-like P-loop ATPase
MTNKNTASDSYLFSADRPIASRNEDKLDRRPFAEEIAGAVRGWRGNDSLVIALYGSWGTGKSSIKNMVIDALRTTPEEASVIDFDPWQIANRTEISQAFFDEIGIAMGRGPVASRKKQKEAAKRWKRYAARLGSGGSLLTLLVKPIRWTLIVSAALLFGLSATLVRPVAITVGVLYVLVALLTWSSKLTEQLAAFCEAGADEQSLEEVKAAARRQLGQLSMPILVVVDDLDRLTPSQLLEMLQLVKANGDLPNLVYLLLCDRKIVEANISEAMKATGGREYLEKIVQIAFDVPLIDRKRVHAVLFEGLSTLLADVRFSKHFDQTRWGNIFYGGLEQYFGTLRQVNRFLSSLSFQTSLFKSEGSFEVNAMDLITLEALRMYEPDLYQALPASKGLLTTVGDFGMGRGDQERQKLNAILDTVPTTRREGARELIKRLFPPAEWAFGGSHYGSGFADSWYRELRVCSEDVFDRYFHFIVPKGDLSQAAVNRLLVATADRDALRGELNSLAGKNLLEVAMDRLEAYKQEIPIGHAVPFVTAMFDIGDQLSSDDVGILGMSSALHAQRIMLWYLKKEPDPLKRAAALKAAIEKTDGLNLPVRFTDFIEPSQQGDAPLEELVPAEALQRLKEICVAKMARTLNSRPLPDLLVKNLLGLLYHWRAWAGPDGPRALSEDLIQTPDGLLQFLRAFVVRARGHALTDHVVTSSFYIRRDDIEAFLPFDLVESKVNSLPKEARLSPEDERAVSAFRDAAERRRTGKSDDSFFLSPAR